MLNNAGFSVLNLPPLNNGFEAFFEDVKAEVQETGGSKYSAGATKRFNDLIAEDSAGNDDTPNSEHEQIGIVDINPDMVARIDQKLLSQILKLITEKGARTRYVKEADRSGVKPYAHRNCRRHDDYIWSGSSARAKPAPIVGVEGPHARRGFTGRV